MQSSCGSGALCLLYICAMKCMKYSNGGGVDRPKRRGIGSSAAAPVNFNETSGKTPRSCNPDAPSNTAAAGGSGITVNAVVRSSSDAGQKAGTLSSKKRLDSNRVISVKEMARQKEKEQKRRMRAVKRSGKPQSNPRNLGTTVDFQ